MSEPFRTSLGYRGRVAIPSAIQEEAGIAVGDRLIVRVTAPGVIVIETLGAALRRGTLSPGKEEANGDPRATE